MKIIRKEMTYPHPPHRNGTRLVLEHSGFQGVSGFLLRSMLGRGWGHKLTEPQHFLAVLDRLAATGDGASAATTGAP